MEAETTAQLREKIAQAREVITRLVEGETPNGSEARRALDYFGGSAFEKDFLPWPRGDDEDLRTDQLNATNDD